MVFSWHGGALYLERVAPYPHSRPSNVLFPEQLHHSIPLHNFIFFVESYERCGTGEDATRIEMNWDTFDAKLVYNDTAFVNTTCCYSEVLRAGAGRLADNDFKYAFFLEYQSFQFRKLSCKLNNNNEKNRFHSRLSACIKLDRSIVLPISSEFIYVKCESGNKLVYNNLHAVVRDRPDVRGRLTKHKEKSLTNRPLSVFMFGIDSVSRLNFIRSMPKTYNYVHDNKWFELLGYNKVRCPLNFHFEIGQ